MATATAKWKAKLAAAKKSGRARISKLKDSDRAKQTAALGGAAVAGAIDGYGVSIEFGEYDVPIGLVVGLPTVMFGGKLSPLLEGGGLGMACYGIGSMVAGFVEDMDMGAVDDDEPGVETVDVEVAAK